MGPARPASARRRGAAGPASLAPRCAADSLPTDGEPIFLAAIWDRWKPRDAGRSSDIGLETFALFTTSPNRVAARIHERMPVIVEAANAPRWLDPNIKSAADVADLLVPYPDALLEAFAVDRAVSSPQSEGPQLIEPHPDAAGAAPQARSKDPGD